MGFTTLLIWVTYERQKMNSLDMMNMKTYVKHIYETLTNTWCPDSTCFSPDCIFHSATIHHRQSNTNISQTKPSCCWRQRCKQYPIKPLVCRISPGYCTMCTWKISGSSVSTSVGKDNLLVSMNSCTPRVHVRGGGGGGGGMSVGLCVALAHLCLNVQ